MQAEWVLISLLVWLCRVTRGSDTLYGESALLFKNSGVQSILHVQRLQKGNDGLRSVKFTVGFDGYPVSFEVIVQGTALTPSTSLEVDLHKATDPIPFIINFIDPQYNDQLIATISYSDSDDSLRIFYENCEQTVIKFKSVDPPTSTCSTTTMQLGQYCSLFCSCDSIPADRACPSEVLFPMKKCPQFTDSYPQCDPDPAGPSHTITYSWQHGVAISKGSIVSRVYETKKEVSFDLLIDPSSSGQINVQLEYVFGPIIYQTSDIRVSYDHSLLLTLTLAEQSFAIRLDVDSQGEVAVVHDDCVQFHMKDTGICYGEGVNEFSSICEEDGNQFNQHAYLKCDHLDIITYSEVMKIYFKDTNAGPTPEADTLSMTQTSDLPGILQTVYRREQTNPVVLIFINGVILADQVSFQLLRGTVMDIEIYDKDHLVYANMGIEFTMENKILVNSNGCTQFEVDSKKYQPLCLAEALDQGELCICNTNENDHNQCQPITNPMDKCITVTSSTVPTTSPIPVVLPQFEVYIYSTTAGESSTASITMSWTVDQDTGVYTFHKEKEAVSTLQASAFHNIDIVKGLMLDPSFEVDISSRVSLSLPMGSGELFVMQYIPDTSGVQLLYHGCQLALIDPRVSTQLSCITGTLNDGWRFNVCPGGASAVMVEYSPCPYPESAKTFSYDLINLLEVTYLYPGTEKMDLKIFWNEERPDFFDFKVDSYYSTQQVQFSINGVEYQTGSTMVFSIGTVVNLDYLVNHKQFFKLEIDLSSPKVSISARDCLQMTLDEKICRSEYTLFYSIKFCSKQETLRTDHILTCSDHTDAPMTLPTANPFSTFKMFFTYTNESRTLTGYVTEEFRMEEGEILERSLRFHWTPDTSTSPITHAVGFMTMESTISPALPVYIYSIPFEVDSPVSFFVFDPTQTKLFEFKIIVDEKTTKVTYKDCEQFEIGEPDGVCYGTDDAQLCTPQNEVVSMKTDFRSCTPSPPPPLTDNRAYYIYQFGSTMFLWDLMFTKNVENGRWVVDASQAGSSDVEGMVVRGMTAVSTLTFEISAGELTTFSVSARSTGTILDSFSILPSKDEITVLYNDCGLFDVGEDREIRCFYQMDTRICTGEPSKETLSYPMRSCYKMRFKLDQYEGIMALNEQNDNYEQELTIIPSKEIVDKMTIKIDDTISDAYHMIPSALSLVSILLPNQESFVLLPIDTTVIVLYNNCQQFNLDQIDNQVGCISDGKLSLCPLHPITSQTNPFSECTFYTVYIVALQLSSPPARITVNHIPIFNPPRFISLITGIWSYSDDDFKPSTSNLLPKMISSSSYALPDGGSAKFEFPLLDIMFDIVMEPGTITRSAAYHNGCFQFYLEDSSGEKCYGDDVSWLSQRDQGLTMMPYLECGQTTSSSPHSTTAGISTSVGSTPGISSTATSIPSSSLSPSTSPPSTSTAAQPAACYYATVVLQEATITIEKTLDFSTAHDRIVFDIHIVFIGIPTIKIYVDSVEYPYSVQSQEVRHNVGERLNITIAGRVEGPMQVVLEIHTMYSTVLELDDCPQFDLERDVDECRGSDGICLCASSTYSCPLDGFPLNTCKTTHPSSPSTSPSPDPSSTEGSPTTGVSSTEATTQSTTVRTTTRNPDSLDNLGELANTTITLDNISQVLDETNTIVNVGSERMEGVHVYYVSEILQNAANISGISQADSQTILDTIDTTLNAPEKSFEDSSKNYDQAPQKFLQVLPVLVVNSASEKLFLNGKQMGFSSRKYACIDEQGSATFGLADTKNGFVDYSDDKPAKSAPKSSIEISRETVCASSGTHSFFGIHRSTKLFLGGAKIRKLAVKSSWYNEDDATAASSYSSSLYRSMLSAGMNGDDDVDVEALEPEACTQQQSLLDDQPVLTATIIDNSVAGSLRIISRSDQEGAKMATVTIDLSQSLRPLHGTLSFSWWNETALAWASGEHCQLRTGQWGGEVIADCFHLTDFTLIVDGTVNDPCVCDTGLIIVGYIISAVSICSLFLVVFATIVNRIPSISRLKAFTFIREDLFRNRFHSVDVLYTISLLFFYLFFTLFHDKSIAGRSCTFFAVITYSLLFCTVLLTLFQSYRTIATFSPYPIIRRALSFASHQIFVCTVSAGAPLIISGILAIVSNFFDRDDGFCWVRPDYITFAVVVPLSVLIVNGIICTILVLIRLYQEQKSQLMTGKNHLKRRIISVLIMQFTLGMPWVLQYLTLYSPTSTAFHYLFTIVNGSQGIVLLLLYIYRRERRMTSMRRRKGAHIAARGVQAREMGQKQRESRDDSVYEDEMDEKSTTGILPLS